MDAKMYAKRQRTLSSDSDEVLLPNRERLDGQSPDVWLLHTEPAAGRGEQSSTSGAHSARQLLRRETDADEPYDSNTLSLCQLEAATHINGPLVCLVAWPR